MKTVKKKPGRPKMIQSVKVSNPFVIEEGVHYVGRSSASQHAQALFDKIKELPVSPTLSIPITRDIAATKNDASNLLLTVKRMLREDDKITQSFTITSKVFKDNNGEYVMTRIWRIA